MVSLLAAQLLNGLAIGMIYALTAFGLSIIKGLLNVPNFAHGAFYALGAYVCFAALQLGLPFAVALLAAFLVPALVGAVVERLGVARLIRGPYLYQLLFLFGVALIMEQLIIIIWGTSGLSAAAPEWLQGAFDLGFTYLPKYLVFNGCMAAVTIAVVWLLIERTRLGSQIRAGIDKREMAQCLGIDVARLVTTGFALGAGLAGLSGGLVLPLLGANATMGAEMLSIAFVVLVIGGLGSLYGALAAGVLVGLIQSVSAVFAPAASTVLIYVAMVATLMIRPQGLFGER
ncbi:MULTISPECIES: branched-chain amino acid ABC transporter permease [unclassified Achromobacter]|uniref:branched-chain amino acid ABC transporter permease n=1 Tax=unclassified Achromobacter TaxID=2626865 RepID=UPI000B51B716|nr:MULTISPECIES: branched-chain amino acid ABC transporter permease [unclassified Achromobacter]OWT74537.1 branched-chain amino acid ABC transporter permease [Achromobacter sp. HZ34]OWT79004.1 branched-chain amino acid ABC transporter permease [Achromobacter sp. HZ28]